MRRVITEHQVNECNRAITLEAGEREPSGAPWHYDVSIHTKDERLVTTHVFFQRGPIAESGTNGFTHERLIAILIDRLRGFQSGSFACEANNRALIHLMEARDALFERTKERLERGVEGTHTV